MILEEREIIRKCRPILEQLQAIRRTTIRRLMIAGAEIASLQDTYENEADYILRGNPDAEVGLLLGQLVDLGEAAEKALTKEDEQREGFGDLDDVIESIENIVSYMPPVQTDHYWIGKIIEINGEREYSHNILYIDKTIEGAIAQHDRYTSRFYSDGGAGKPVERAKDGAYDFGGGIICYADDIREISLQTYEELKALEV